MEPVDPFTSVSLAQFREWGGIVAYTAVYAPAGLRETISHVWLRDGTPFGTIRLSPVLGGRTEGYRTYSWRSDLGPSPAGRWTVDAVTASGQLIGRVRFTVTP
jgi:hypothetical protein